MADIELVIKIPEEIYKNIMSTQSYIFDLSSGKSFFADIIKAIRTGTPLSKGHGNLIDADAYKEEVFKKFTCNNRLDRYIRRVTELAISDAPTIIEADNNSKIKS